MSVMQIGLIVRLAGAIDDQRRLSYIDHSLTDRGALKEDLHYLKPFSGLKST
jgi:hypothetical protein